MTRRSERVAEAIRRICSIVVHSKLRDKRIGEFITITKVEATEDLRFAKVYYTVLGDEKKKKNANFGLLSAKNFIKKQIADDLELRYAPDIVFCVDKSAEHSGRIDEILANIHKKEKKE
ncbi:MAG: 30S ribosome-binding factor RbfA, partial [Candidatus Omnitrophota bacterium]